MIRILVVIPMYGFREMTEKCIEMCLANAGIEHEIIVVDDGSPEPFDSDHNVLRLEENTGYTNAVNQGLIWADNKYEYVCLLSNDTEPKPGFLKELVEAMDRDPSVAISCPSRIVEKDGLTILEAIGADLTRGHVWTLLEHPKEPIEALWIPFACVMLRSSAVRYLGLLDRRMRNYSSDTDYCIRAVQAGYKVLLVPSSVVYHHHEVTTKHLKVSGHEDNKVFLEKLAGVKNQEVLNQLPLDAEASTWGRLSFIAYKK